MKLTTYVDFERWWNNGVLLHKVPPARVADGHDLEDGAKTLITGVALGIVAEYVVVFLNSSTPSFEQVIGIPVFGLVLVGNTAFWVAVFTAGSVAASDRSRVVPAATLACYALAGLIPIVLVTAGEQLNEAIKLFRVRQDPCLPYLAAATFDLLSPTNATALALIRSGLLLALQLGAAIWYLGVALCLTSRREPRPRDAEVASRGDRGNHAGGGRSFRPVFPELLVLVDSRTDGAEMIARILVLILSFQVSDVSIVRMNPIPLRDANETDRGMRLEATLRAPFPVASVTMYCRPAGASEYQALLLGRDKRLNYVAVYPRTIALDYYLVVRPTRGEPIPVWSAEDPATLDPAGIAATVIEGGKGKSILISVVTAIAALIGTGIGAAGPAGNEPSAPPPVTTLPPAASPSPPVSPTPTPSAAPSPPSQSDTASAHGERSSDLDRWNHISGSWTECGGAGTLVVTVAGESIRGSLHRGGTVITLSGYRQTGLPEDWILVAMNKAPERSAVHGVLKAIAHDPRRQPALVLRIDGRSDLSFCR